MSINNINQLPASGAIQTTDVCIIRSGAAVNDQQYSAVTTYNGGSTSVIANTDKFLFANANTGRSFWVTGTQLKAYLAGSSAVIADGNVLIVVRAGAFYQATGAQLKTFMGVSVQLAVPGFFTATSISNAQINLTWNAVTFATSYTLQRATNSGFTTGLTTIYTGSTASFNDTGLAAVTVYYYRVKATAGGYLDSNYATDSTSTQSAAVFSGMSNLSAFTGYFADAKAGTRNVKIIPIGDSNMEFPPHTVGFTAALQNAAYNIYGQGHANIGDGGQTAPFGNENWGEYDTETWPNTGLNTWDKRSLNLYEQPSTAVDQKFPMASYHLHDTDSYEKARYIDIYYIAQAGGGTFEVGEFYLGTFYIYDDPIDTSDTTGAGSGGWKKISLDTTGAAAAALDKPTLRVTSQGTAGCTLLHVITRNEDGQGIKFLNFGHNGATSGHYATATATTMWKEMFAEVAKAQVAGDKALAIINLGTNDNRGSISAATYKTNIKAIIANIRTALPGIGIILYSHPYFDIATWSGTDAAVPAYLAKLQEVVTEDGVGLVDLSSYGTLIQMVSNDYYNPDKIHWAKPFGTDLGQKVLTALGAI